MESLISKVYPELKYVSVNSLSYDDAYQRILMPGHVKDISRTFDPNAFQPITVNQREDGTLVVIDGQHRVEAVKENGDPTLTFVPAQVLYLSRDEEVELFYKINVTKKGLSPVDKFYPEVLQKHPDAMFIHETLIEIGVLTIPSRAEGSKKVGEKANNQIDCVATMKKVYRNCVMAPNEDPGAVLKKTLWLIADNWSNTKSNTQAIVVAGLSSFLNMYDGTDFFEMDRLEEVMRNHKPLEVKQLASSFPTPENNGAYDIKKGENLRISQALRVLYNQARKNNPITDSLALWLQDDDRSVINNKRNYIN